MLRLQCADGGCHEVSFDVARISPRLSHIVDEIMEEFERSKDCNIQDDDDDDDDLYEHHNVGFPALVSVGIGAVPSEGVSYAIEYCKAVWNEKNKNKSSMKEWHRTFDKMGSRVLCEVASAAYHFDLQPLVDSTCRAIAHAMSESDTASQLRETFGLDDDIECDECCGDCCGGNNNNDDDDDDGEYDNMMLPCGSENCHCSLRGTFGGLEMDILKQCGNHLFQEGDDEDAGDDDDDFDDTLPDENVKVVTYKAQPSVDELVGFINGTSTSNSNSTTKKKKKKKKKKAAQKKNSNNSNSREEPEQQHLDNSAVENNRSTNVVTAVDDLAEKLRLASVDPSAIFDESKFEDDDDPEVEVFRKALEEAHKVSLI